MEKEIPVFKSLVAGGMAGLSVDTLLFPLDTLKTRLQSTRGFIPSGGFKNIYRGLSSSIIGSVPSASLFYLTYDSMKQYGHLKAACLGELIACLVRVPIDNIKQQMQVGTLGLRKQIHDIYRNRGFFGFYKSYFVTVMRDVPFACIQFPLYEYLKTRLGDQSGNNPLVVIPSGMIAGGFSAAVTTPIDVLKTNMTLNPTIPIREIIRKINPIAGIGPRIIWISIGGSIFLSTHDLVLSVI
jgi:solute carrier family 25 S-adenosylmethionine transporter 26